MGVYRPMSSAGREVKAARPILIVSMSPPSYSLARLRPRRAGLRFTRRAQFTVANVSVPESCDCCRRCCRFKRASSNLRSRSVKI